MECNKEEAIRAKEIAEKKMQDKDFAGARKIALKAQQLYSNLENISQMLTVCDVHCSSELRVLGTDMNWYSILQLEQTADEASIKKQYRKLALLLHPDKNKFAGAEAAFKLIGEAQRMLSDPLKRSVYDMKYKASLNTTTSRPPQQQHRNRNVRKHPVVNTAAQQQPPRPPTQPVFNTERPTFWTACPFCNMRYQYYKEILNRALRCQGCTKPFIAYDLNVQGVPPAANWSQPAAPVQPNQFPSQTNFHPGAGFQAPFGFGATAPIPSQKAGVTSEAGKGSKTKAEDGDVNKEEKKESKEGPKFKADKPNRSSKRGRRSGENSSESCGTESSTDSDEYEKFYSRGGVSRQENYESRRSSRQKQHVSYNEDLSDDDLGRPSKKSKGSRSAASAAEDQSEASLKEEASEINKHAGSSAVSNDDKEVKRHKAGNRHGENLPNGNGKAEECKTNKNEAEAMEDDMERTKVDSKVDSDGSNPTKLEPEFFEVPDPDFYDFDKDRKEESFEVDQLWACYDEIDGMPRFYARIRKVFSPGFKVKFTWLEADPDEDEEIVWFNEDLPFACGKFKHGKTETTEDIGMFSHLVYFEKGGPRQAIYKILPRKSQVWAVFKNWDINWSSDAAKHKEYEFEFVEVLSDYDQELGISVAYLVKVKGFVSLFRLWDEMIPVRIPQNELLRFSHMVPSYKTTGTERENVPNGYFELDPASLPDNIESVADLEEVKGTTERTDSTINNSCSKVPLQETNMPGMSTDADEKKSQEPRNSGSRSRSPVEQSLGQEKQSQETVGQNTVKEENGKNSNQANDSFQDGSVPVNMQSDDIEMSDSVPEDSSLSEFPEFSEIPEAEYSNFDIDRTKDKLLPGQIWALYCEVDGLPKYYAQIQKVHSSPCFKAEIKWVEPCLVPNHMIQWSEKDIPISCGKFGLGGSQDFSDTSTFSHLSTAKPTDKKNKYEIYPKKDEVWALYKNPKSEWDLADVEKADYEMVEVIDASNLMTKVLILERVGDHKSVFKAKEVGASPISFEIPRVDLLRFSHRIPAFRITADQDDVRIGFWELDPKAMPICFFR